MIHPHDEEDPLQPHAHDPNPTPPSDDPTITLILPHGRVHLITLADLKALPETSVADCYIVSTGHGTSGPFTFTGLALPDFVQSYVPAGWSHLEIVSGDGFGSRVMAAEVTAARPALPFLLAYGINGRALTRQEGLVRLIVPSERDDAMRQVKWVGEIRVRP